MSEQIGCPKCGSTQLTTNEKGFSGGKAVAGAVLTGGIGLLAGFHGKNKVIITCLACGKKFKPGEGKVIVTNPNGTTTTKAKDGCFIATACYGDYNAPQVLVLRDYRDTVLVKSYFGRLFINSYYAISPPIANFIAKSEILKTFIRRFIVLPIVKILSSKLK